MELSVIVPLYNEEDNIQPLYDAITREVGRLGIDYEIVFVDDCSKDATFQLACQLASKDHRLKVIKFRKNYGQTAAMAAGIEHANGKILVTMDGDLQNDPADIYNFIENINAGYDIVVGWRHKRQDKLITRKIPSKIANWIIGKVTGVPIKDNGCSLKAFRAEIIKDIPLYSEMHRFIPAMASLAGVRIAEIKVRHHARQFGVSKYGLSRIYKVILDLLVIKTIVSFTARPLLWFALLALPAMIASFFLIFYSLYYFTVHSSPLNVSIAGTGLLFGALAFFLFLGGVLSELVYKTGNMRMDNLSMRTAKTIQTRKQA